MKRRLLAVVFLACAALFALTSYIFVTAQSGGGKSYPEGQAPGAVQESSSGEFSAKRAAEGSDPNAVLSSGTLAPGQPGPTSAELMGGGGAPLLYQFSGVVDDGAKGANGKAATSVTCSNPTAVNSAMMVYVFNYDSQAYYTAIFNLLPGTTITISTQPTALYFDDIVLRASGTSDAGTAAIYQGMGKVFSTSTGVICTAHVLDPTGSPPAFMTRLTLHAPYGIIATQLRPMFVPFIKR